MLRSTAGARSNDGAAMNVPSDPRGSTSPRRRASASARVTVVRSTPSSAASSRCGGSRSPGASPPSAIARSRKSAICM